jgi:hypothetical protein
LDGPGIGSGKREKKWLRHVVKGVHLIGAGLFHQPAATEALFREHTTTNETKGKAMHNESSHRSKAGRTVGDLPEVT